MIPSNLRLMTSCGYSIYVLYFVIVEFLPLKVLGTKKMMSASAIALSFLSDVIVMSLTNQSTPKKY